jgi:Raf kinase inhibitor-like YbhB/YbcL family protein
MGFALADITVTSSAFEPGGAIPEKYTGEGEDVSPALSWDKLPEGTRSVAVFCHDPDAPLAKPGAYGFTHWLLYNLSPETNELPEHTGLGTEGGNDFGKTGYNGPMPPDGHGMHHYYFWVVALDQNLELKPGLSLEEFLEKTEPHIIGMNRMIGTYERA